MGLGLTEKQRCALQRRQGKGPYLRFLRQQRRLRAATDYRAGMSSPWTLPSFGLRRPLSKSQQEAAEHRTTQASSCAGVVRPASPLPGCPLPSMVLAAHPWQPHAAAWEESASRISTSPHRSTAHRLCRRPFLARVCPRTSHVSQSAAAWRLAFKARSMRSMPHLDLS